MAESAINYKEASADDYKAVFSGPAGKKVLDDLRVRFPVYFVEGGLEGARKQDFVLGQASVIGHIESQIYKD